MSAISLLYFFLLLKCQMQHYTFKSLQCAHVFITFYVSLNRMTTGEVRKRFYVGNLPEAVTEIDLNKLFSKYGKVAQSEVKTKKDIDGAVKNTFGFITLVLAHEAKASEVIKECSNLKWKKHVIKVQGRRDFFNLFSVFFTTAPKANEIVFRQKCTAY